MTCENKYIILICYFIYFCLCIIIDSICVYAYLRCAIVYSYPKPNLISLRVFIQKFFYYGFWHTYRAVTVCMPSAWPCTTETWPCVRHQRERLWPHSDRVENTVTVYDAMWTCTIAPWPLERQSGNRVSNTVTVDYRTVTLNDRMIMSR